MRSFVAPGKVVLVGEYAVVDGAPAVVAAIDRGVRVIVDPGGDDVVVEAPGDGSFARAALGAAQAPPGSYRFRDQRPTDTDGKAGFGGSAAAVVAAVTAGLALRGVTADPASRFALADAVHRAVQGAGSGIDVAASCWGGTLRFRRGDPPEVRPLAPVADRLVIVWSGASAKTGPRLQAYLAAAGRPEFVAESTQIVDRFEQDPIAALREATALLAAFTTAAGIDWWTPAHARIAAHAAAVGGAAKPSGAGGGDCAVAILPDPDAARSFADRCARDGLPPIAACLAPAAAEEPDVDP